MSAQFFRLLLATVIIPVISSGQGITTPRDPSPAAEVRQTIGISTITVNYSRPSVKGRPVWGNLAHYGFRKQGFGFNNPSPWRAGANENTTITLSHDGTINGKPVPAGTYGLFYAVNADNTAQLILSRENKAWGSFFYDSTLDALRTSAEVRAVPHVELLTYDFLNPTHDQVDLALSWEKKQFVVKVGFDVDKIVLANAAQELKGPAGFTWQGFAAAANYALQSRTGYEQGLQWINQALLQNRSFVTLNTKANLLKAMGNNEEANRLLDDVLKVATEAELNQYGYQVMGQGDLDKAIEVFSLNTKRNPKSPNAFDSLGEAYFTKGDKKNAAVSFKKALSLNPPSNVKANSEKFLEQLEK